MKTRKKLQELYIILLEYYKRRYNGQAKGICLNIENLITENILTQKEGERLYRHFLKQRPTEKKYKKFFKHPSFQNSGWWWETNAAGVEQRIRFLELLALKDWDKRVPAFESLFPIKAEITQEIIDNANIYNVENCIGALTLKSVLPKKYAKTVSWGVYSGGITIEDDRVETKENIRMTQVESPRTVTFTLK